MKNWTALLPTRWRVLVLLAALALMASLVVVTSPAASAAATQGGGVTLSMEGDGAVGIYHKGELYGPVRHTVSPLPVFVDELVLTTDADEIPASGAGLVAIPDEGARFAGWSGSANGTETQTVRIWGNETFHATFVPDVVAMADGDGYVTVETLDGELLCDTVRMCEADLEQGDHFVVTAIADPIADFSTFAGPCLPIGNDQAVCVYGSPLVSAQFFTPSSELTVTVSGASGGYIHVEGHGQCGSSCTYDLPVRGPAVQLSESTHEAVFTGWSGACSGNGPCHIDPVAGDQRVTGHFTAIWD